MKILVTGANGFVGSHLCEKLLKDGHEVFALVRNSRKISLKHHLFKIVVGDLDLESLPWIDSLPENLDACIHTAGIVHSFIDNEFYRVNAGGTENLVNNLKGKFPKLHFVLISSLASAGPGLDKNKKNEADMDFPVSVYGSSKKKAEDVLKKNAPLSWEISIVRPPMVIGPRDSAVLDIFKMVRSGLIILPGSNSRKKHYSFVCVLDLVETISQITEKKKSGLFYSAHPQTVTFDELILEIKKQLNKNWLFYIPLPLFFVRLITILLSFFYRIYPHGLRLTPDKYHELAAINWTCDGKKTEDELGQVYNYNLERTITVTLLDYKTRNWI